MRTRKDISTISYNTVPYLTARLIELYKNHDISDWFFIYHFKEADETKDHIHLFIRPNKTLDTMDIQAFMKEYDPADPTKKPLGCIDFRSSSVDHAILYFMHYKPYLASLGESREYSYLKEDFIICDSDSFDEMYNHAHKGSDWSKKNQLLQMLSDNTVSPADLVLSGHVSLNQASQLNAFYYMKNQYGLERNGRANHEYEPSN